MMDILQVNELKQSLERRDARILELERQLEATRQERGEAVAWVRCHPDGTLTTEFLADAAIEPVRRNSKAWIPLYLHPTPDAGRVAELEAECKRLREEVHAHASNEVDFAEQNAALEAKLAETEAQAKHFDWHISYIRKELTDSLEREWRMREALTVYGVHSINCINDDNRCVCGFDAVLDYALAAEKEGE